MPRVGKSYSPRDCVAATRIPEDIHRWLRSYAEKRRKSVSDILYECILDKHERDMEVGSYQNKVLRRRAKI